MIRLIRKQDIQALAVTFVLLMGIGLSLYLSVPVPDPSLNYPISRSILLGMAGKTVLGGLGAFLVAWLLILIQAFYFNVVLNKHRVLHKSTFLPALFFGYICLLFPSQLIPTPEMLANFLIILALGSLFSMQGQSFALVQLVNAGICIGLAILMLPQIALLIPLFLLAIFLFKPARGNDFLQFLLGVTFPLYFGFIIAFLRGQHAYGLEYFSGSLLRPSWTDLAGKHVTLAVLAVLLLFLLIVLLRLQQNFFRNTIQVRKYQQFLIVYFFFSLAMVLFSAEGFQQAFIFLAAPVSTFLAYYFLPEKRPWLQEVIFFLLLGALYINQVWTLA